MCVGVGVGTVGDVPPVFNVFVVWSSFKIKSVCCGKKSDAFSLSRYRYLWIRRTAALPRSDRDKANEMTSTQLLADNVPSCVNHMHCIGTVCVFLV